MSETQTVAKYSIMGRRVFVAGHRGMVGAAVVRRLQSENCEALTAARSHLDLTDQAAVRAWFARENKPFCWREQLRLAPRAGRAG